VVSEPSTNALRAQMPITPPHVRAPADQFAQLDQLGCMAKDVSIRSGLLVGQDHDPPSDRLARIGQIPHPPCQGVPHASGQEARLREPKFLGLGNRFRALVYQELAVEVLDVCAHRVQKVSTVRGTCASSFPYCGRPWKLSRKRWGRTMSSCGGRRRATWRPFGATWSRAASNDLEVYGLQSAEPQALFLLRRSARLRRRHCAQTFGGDDGRGNERLNDDADRRTSQLA
jgi:hypothetical protein